jgi:hypothetical protein
MRPLGGVTIARAVGFGDRPAARRMRLVSWRPITKGRLLGFAIVELPNGLKVHDCPVLVSKGKAWASLSNRPVLDADGRHVVDHTGHRRYAGLLGWRDRDLAYHFSVAVVELVRHADLLEEMRQ